MAGFIPSSPFVLLDDARDVGAVAARLYVDPVEVITANTIAGIAPALDQARQEQANGRYVAGYLSYDASAAFEPKLAARDTASTLLWFGVFDGYEEIAAEAVTDWLPDPDGAWAAAPVPNIRFDDYAAAFEKVQAYIAAGDIYQANLTFQNTIAFAGHPLSLYANIRRRAKAGYGGVVWTGTDWVLSFSPELFFALHNGKVTTKPMKGTAKRCPDPAADMAAGLALQNDPKQRAENLMIVDLLRNDVSRVAVPGSVAVPKLFALESYPTVHQMVSTVTAEVTAGVDGVDVIAALFPCGSITGAPKIRAMEIVAEVEQEQRGLYTGSIGRMDPDGHCAFNVAIRTLHIEQGASRATLGLGGGLVADSQLHGEWEECLAKGAFVNDTRQFDLIETMRFHPEEGIFLLERHLSRMKDSARTLGFEFDRHAARNDLQAATFLLTGAHKIRLLLSRLGHITIEIAPLPPMTDAAIGVRCVPLSVEAHDFRLRHKTTDRAFYDQARIKAGCSEVVFTDHDGYLTEGSFTNVFVRRDGVLLTPPLSRGLLPGVLREELIETGIAVEAKLTPDDLKEAFFVGNAVRGLIPAVLA
jgi:para-aminobenzoate synthetase / 4-amino-4-deoxychorismate lyase